MGRYTEYSKSLARKIKHLPTIPKPKPRNINSQFRTQKSLCYELVKEHVARRELMICNLDNLIYTTRDRHMRWIATDHMSYVNRVRYIPVHPEDKTDVETVLTNIDTFLEKHHPNRI